ncbi:MAG: caspase family protein [Bacteroidota bacterium]
MNSLPKYFPVHKLSRLNRSKVTWFYRRYVEEYYEHYTFGHFILAAYAAIPAYLTPDLLYKIWLNFNQYEWRNKVVNIHRIAVSDVLLAPFCREIGYELYEMDNEIRDAFLEWLELSSRSEIWRDQQLQTPQTIAEFLQEYQRLPNPGTIRWGKSYEETQTWNNWLIINPEKSQQLLTERVKKAEVEKDEIGMLRAMDFWSNAKGKVEVLFGQDEAVSQWADFKQNATFMAALKAQIQGNSEAFAQMIEDNPFLKTYLNREPEGGIEVKLSKAVEEFVEKIPPPTIFAAVIGINQYENTDVHSLTGCVNDAEAFKALLETYAQKQDKPLDLLSLLDEEATFEAMQEMITHFRQARNGDVCVLYFAGHTHYLNLEENKGRRFLLYDSDKAEKEITQNTLEEWLYPLLSEKEVAFLIVLDTHEAKEEFKADLPQNLLRKNERTLKGSLIYLNAGMPGQATYERQMEGKTRGAFTYALEKVLEAGGFEKNYRQITELVNLRMLRSQEQQTPFVEAIPTFAANNLFLTNITDAETTYEITWEEEAQSWRLVAGRRQGITPSLDFMLTELAVKDGTRVQVREVFEDYSYLYSFEADQSATLEAVLLQTALPKIKVAYDENLDRRLRERLEEAIERHNIYYIDVVENPSEAQYFIRNREREYYLSRKSSRYQRRHVPLFNFQYDAFELIKQMEYIAQWTGVLELNRNSNLLKRKDVEVSIEAIEGISIQNIDAATPTMVYKDPELVQINYQKLTQDWLMPAFRCKIINQSNKKVYVNALYLDSTYGILDFGQYEMEGSQILTRSSGFDKPDFTYLTFDEERTILLNIDEAYLRVGRTEIVDYIKLFISEEPLYTEPILQDSLELKRENLRKSVSTQFQANTFDLSNTDWIAIAIPIKITRQEKEARQQEQQLWENASEQHTFEGYEDYLKVFPNGRWAEVVREKLEQMLMRQESSAPSYEETEIENESNVELNAPVSNEAKIFPEAKSAFDNNEPSNSDTPKITNLANLKRELKQLLTVDKSKEALELLRTYLRSGASLENDLILLSSRFNATTRDVRRGLVTREQAQIAFSRVNYALMNYIDDLEEADVVFPKEKTFQQKTTTLSNLEQQGLLEEAELLQKRINRINRALALETDPSRQLAYEEQVAELSEKLAVVKRKLG